MKSIWRWLIGMVLIIGVLWAQNYTPNDLVPGQMILRLRPGETIERARAIANAYNADLRPIEVPDTYVLTLRENLPAQALVDKTVQVVEQIKNEPGVLYIEPNWILQRHEIPNDPLFSQQWALTMIKAPGAWDTEKGQAGIRIAFIDDNFQTSHPDLAGRFDPLSRNFATDDEGGDTNIDPEAPGFSHGTSTMGVAAANTNNGQGIAGLCWEGVTIVALKVAETPDSPLRSDAILRSYQYVLDNASQIHVLNMSYGGFFPSPQVNDFMQRIYQAGVIPVASAGNHGSSVPSYPASFPNVVKVSAVGPDYLLASYSAYGGVTITAPGGDQEARYEDGVLTTASTSQRYEYVQGTSYSAPYVSAALALVLSAGVRRHTAADTTPPALEILMETADPRGRQVPDPEFGAGIIDVEAALRGLGGASIAFVEPTTGATFDTRRVKVKVTVRRVLDNATDNITIKVNEDVVPRSEWAPNAVVDVARKSIFIEFIATFPGEGRHTVEVSAVGQDGLTKTASIQVIIKAHVQQKGLTMFAVPYQVSQRPEEIFGPDVVLARYLPEQGTYARYTLNNPDENASFNPPNVDVRPVNSSTPTPPRGLGYFLRTPAPGFILGDEQVDTNAAYRIPLQPGWNMIGNPFPFNVPWNACEVEITGAEGITERITLQEAADRDYIRLQIYRYLPLTGSYTWRTAPLGELRAWEAHWVRALKPCVLIVPPVGSLRSTPDDSQRITPNAGGGWLVRLAARSGDREDANNFIGAGVRPESVEKPPLFQSYVNLTIREPRSRAALAQDVRPGARRAQRWEVEVTTDQPNAEVTLTWNQEMPVPKGARLVLTDTVTGAKISMLQQSAYTFRTDETSRRRFVIEFQPSRIGQLRITNIGVTRTRGNQFSIQYALSGNANVQVQIQDASGKPVARLQSGSRAAGLNSVTWNGRTDDGIAVPPGAYQVQIIATTEEGETARVVRPIVITR
ncbi:MAG: S8 family serine peptidase [Fimbriimonadales bacterium]|jgi:thermitase|nr:S8 family serine peptidase [Fimbriimonadales bacterium]GBC89781.1 Thermophilic serine proteinase [bacterium HR14]